MTLSVWLQSVEVSYENHLNTRTCPLGMLRLLKRVSLASTKINLHWQALVLRSLFQMSTWVRTASGNG